MHFPPTIHNAQIRHGPLKPPNMSRSPTQPDTSLGKVYLECVASFSEPSKAKWLFGESELSKTDGRFEFSQEQQDTNRDKFICEIKNLDKSQTGVYKLVLISAEGRENIATFNLPLVGIEKCNWTNVAASLTMDPMVVREVPLQPLEEEEEKKEEKRLQQRVDESENETAPPAAEREKPKERWEEKKPKRGRARPPLRPRPPPLSRQNANPPKPNNAEMLPTSKKTNTAHNSRWMLPFLLVIFPLGSANFNSLSISSLNEMDFTNAEKLSTEELNRELSQAEKRWIYQSDIRSTRRSKSGQRDKRNGVSRVAKLWPNARIPYVISTHYSPHERALLAKAVKQYHDRTCVRFLPRSASDKA
ncbi:hypothetical protein niasHT_015625 [Heterodera trifolii]|uniref:Peptidase M12A domain-containing protein n=1 Tax=Heterodera trifolii TaxID=157864 RepID=A0ABD2L525_9BILA